MKEKQLKKSASVSVVSVISDLVGDGYFADIDYTKVANIRGTLSKVYRKWLSLSGDVTAHDELIAFEGSLDSLSLSYIKYMQAKKEYDYYFGIAANDAVNTKGKVVEAINDISKDTNFSWFTVSYLSEHGYPVDPTEQCTTNQQLSSYIAKLYATALTEKQEVAKTAKLIGEYIERSANRLNQLKDWNVPITEDVVNGIISDTLAHETDSNVINNVTKKVKATFAK